MENLYNSPYSYWPSFPYYTLADYHNHTLPEDYISPNSYAAQLRLTPTDMALILQKQHKLMQNEFTQPLTQPTTYHNHTTWAKSPE